MRVRRGSGAGSRQTLVAALAVALAATCLHTVLLSNHWYAAVLLVVAVVAALGLAGRRLNVPPAFAGLVQLVGIVVVCTRLFAHQDAFGGVVPTAASMTDLGTVASAGADTLRSALFPAAVTPGLSFLAVALCGLVALAVDLLAAGARRPAFAGLPLVLLVALPAAVRERSVGFLPLLATALGFLLLLTLDGQERTSRWGRTLPAPGAELPSTVAGAAAPALQIGLLSVALAVIVPVAIPGAGSSPFGVGDGGDGSGGSSSSATIIDPLVSVSADLKGDDADQTLLTVSTAQPTYLRLTALDQFGANGFTLGAISAGTGQRVSHGIAPDPSLAPTVPTISLSDSIAASGALQEMLLPVPYGTTEVTVHGDWRLSSDTRTIFSASASTSDARWQVEAQVPAPTAAELKADGPVEPDLLSPEVADDLAVPGDLTPLVQQTAEAWTKGQTTEYGKALALQQHFTDGSFTYSTDVQYQGGNAGFTAFLQQRSGFCEQYATTMTAMLRTLGIPARVAIGFVPGTRTPDGSYAVTGGDAHAWPEVWFAGVGWVRFEPTPRSDGRSTAPSYTTGQPGTVGTAPGGGTSTAPTPTPTTGPSTAPSAGGPAGHKKVTGSGADGSATPPHHGSATPWVLLGVLVVLVLLAVPGLFGALVRRRRRRSGSLEALWRQLLDDATDVGSPVPVGASPRAAGALVLRAATPYGEPHADVRAAVDRLVGSVERTRYSRDGSGGAAAGELVADERRVRAALVARFDRGRRLWTVLVPTSVVQRARRWAGSLLPRALATVDRLTPRRGAAAR